MKKSETFSCFKKFKAWAENQTGSTVKAPREDKGGEYMSKEFDDFCAEHGIQRQHSVRARPQQNGVAECANRTMEQGIISMLHQAGLPLPFWGEALSAFLHVWNRTPTSAVPGKTPHEAFLGTKPDVFMLRVWGAVLPMSTSRRTRETGEILGPIWRSASSLATLMTTRGGSSTIPVEGHDEGEEQSVLMGSNTTIY